MDGWYSPTNLDAALSLAGQIVRSGLADNVITERRKGANGWESVRLDEAAATARVLGILAYGAELGWPPMRSLRLVQVVEGRLCLGVDGIRALVAGNPVCAYLRAEVQTDESATWSTARVTRDGVQQPRTYTYTLADARAAGLLERNSTPWRTHPARMLSARACKYLCQDVYPDVLTGCLTDDEAREIAAAGRDEAPQMRQLPQVVMDDDAPRVLGAAMAKAIAAESRTGGIETRPTQADVATARGTTSASTHQTTEGTTTQRGTTTPPQATGEPVRRVSKQLQGDLYNTSTMVAAGLSVLKGAPRSIHLEEIRAAYKQAIANGQQDSVRLVSLCGVSLLGDVLQAAWERGIVVAAGAVLGRERDAIEADVWRGLAQHVEVPGAPTGLDALHGVLAAIIEDGRADAMQPEVF